MSRKPAWPWASILFILISSAALGAESSWVKEGYRSGDFKLVYGGRAADILVAPEDFKVVQIAASDLAADVERVTGRRPALRSAAHKPSEHLLIAGTLGRSPFVDGLVREGKLDVSDLRGQWESFAIATVRNPLPGAQVGLVVVGSDRRGTAYGLYALSEAIGVSPWYWWADVHPARRARLVVSSGLRREGPPSVQYRGIFLNDEDWGLHPWAAKTFEPESGGIGPKTYARIFELLLRLRANTLWPAMHKVTRPFNSYPEIKELANDYAIVMGSSHAEPMLRNNVGEWTDDPKAYDYTKNPEGVRRYWEERLRENGRFENLYTLGMRGIHDSAIQGPKTQRERIDLLEEIFSVQRELIAIHVSPDVTKVPQIFVPYKEVLADYRMGLKVPEDVTIVWPDDNFGHIRYFPTAEERRRAGGFGVYYHISYLGQPLSYIWLNTTAPALIWEEMTKAYEHGVRRFWVVNVGDIKPGEIGMEFFMQMAWDIGRWTRERLPEFLPEWARREFGVTEARELAAVMDEYYRLGSARKPEHLQWYLPGEQPRPSDLTQIDYGDEVQERLDAYERLMARVNRLYESTPRRSREAFYELVVYPVRASALANRRYFFTEKCAFYLEQGRASAAVWARRAADADAQLKYETAFFNELVAGGKWRHMIAMEMGPGEWMSMRSTPPTVPPALSEMRWKEKAGLGVAIEGRRAPVGEDEKDAALPVLSVYTGGARFIDLFNTGRSYAPWTAQAKERWLRLSRTAGDLSDDARIFVSVDWAHAPKGESVEGSIEISAAGETRTVLVPVFNPPEPRPESLSGYIESGGVVAMEAEHFTRKVDRGQAGWQIVPGLGRTGDSVAVFPTDTPSVTEASLADKAPVLEYSFHLFKPGRLAVNCYLLPTLPLVGGRGLRYAVGIDDAVPQVVAVDAGLPVPSKQWSQNVLNQTTTGRVMVDVKTAGGHVLKIYMVDAGVVLDKIVMDGGGARPSYLGPKETGIRQK